MTSNSSDISTQSCLEQLFATKNTLIEISECLSLSNNNKEFEGDKQIDDLSVKLAFLTTQITTLESTFKNNINHYTRDDLSVDLIMQLEIDVEDTTNEDLEECCIDEADMDITNTDKECDDGWLSNEIVNSGVLEEMKQSVKLLQESTNANKALKLRLDDLQSKYSEILDDYNNLKIKFEKLKQLTIKGRQEERLARDKINSERESYELCISKSDEKLAKFTDEIYHLKNNNSQLMVFIQELEQKIKNDKEDQEQNLENLNKNLDIKIKELEMSRQANEFLNDGHLNLKMTLKDIQQQQHFDRKLLEEQIQLEFIEQLNTLQKQLADKEAEILTKMQDSESKNKSYENEIDKVRINLNQVKTQLKNMVKENQLLKNEIQQLANNNSSSISLEQPNIEECDNKENIKSTECVNETIGSPKKFSFNLDSVLNSSAASMDCCNSSQLTDRLEIDNKVYFETLTQSENTSFLLQQQISVLQKEIRRLEQNQSRVESIKNMESLKDMIVKFITNSPDYKKNVVPLLSKTLALNDSELVVLKKFSEMDINFNPLDQSSWFDYLKPW